MVTNDETSGNFKHAWPSETLIVGNSILTVADKKQLSKKNQVVKVWDFRGPTIDDLKHRLVPLLRKNPEDIILHIVTNDSNWKTSRQILDQLLQLKQYITNMLPPFRVIVCRPTMRTDICKAVLTSSNLNTNLGQLKEEFINNVNIKEVHLGKKGQHLNEKKVRLDLSWIFYKN